MSEPKTRKPKVRLVLDKHGFNALIQGLIYNEANEHADTQTSESAAKLTRKINKFSRLFDDDNGVESVDVRFFDNEAAELIWQFIFTSSAEAPGEDFYAVLKEKRNKDG